MICSQSGKRTQERDMMILKHSSTPFSEAARRFAAHRRHLAQFAALGTLALVGLAAQPASAQSTYVGPSGTATLPKTGSWSVATNWSPNGVPVSGSTTSLLFGGSSGAGTIYTSTDDIAGAFSLNSLTFNSTATATDTIAASAGSSLNFVANGSTQPAILQNGSGAFTVSAPVSIATGSTLSFGGTGAGLVTLSGVLSGSGGLAVNNATSGSVLTLSGANGSYTGAVTVTNGTLKMGGTSALTAANALTVNGGTFDNNNQSTFVTVGSLSGTGGSVTNSGASTKNMTINGSATTTYGGLVSGNLGLALSGTTNLTLTGTNTNVGGVTLNSGTTLTTTNTQGLGNTTGTANILNTGGTLNLLSNGAGSNGTIVFGSASSPAGYGFQVNGNANLNIGTNGANTGNTVQIGTLDFKTTGSLNVGTSNGYKLAVGAINSTSGTGASATFNTAADTTVGTIAYGIIGNTNRTLTFSGAGNTTVTGTIASTQTGTGTFAITKNGAGILTLQGTGNTYTGTTAVSAGELRLDNTANSGTGTGAVNETGGALSGTGSAAGLVTVTNAAVLAPGDNSAGNFGTAGTLGAGTTGGATLSSATLDFDLASAFNGTNDLLTTGGPLSLGTLSFTFNELTGTLDTSNPYTLISGATGVTGFTTGNYATAFLGGANYTPTYSVNGNNLLVRFAPIVAAPEPSAWAGLLVGALGVGTLALRARRRVAA